MFKKFLFYVFSLFFIASTFALTWSNLPDEKLNCNTIKNKFSIIWPSVTKVWIESTYKIDNLQDDNIWTIVKDWKVVYTYTWNKFNYRFQKAGNVLINVKFDYENCNILLTKKVDIYKKIVLSIKEEKVSFVPYEQLNKKWIFYKNIKLKDLKDNKYLLKLSDYIIVWQSDIIDFFANKEKINLNTKKIILLINSFKSFYSKFIIPYVKSVSQNNIYVYDENSFLNILELIYQWKWLDDKNLFVVSSIWDKIYFPLSYFVNKLIENGLDINKLWLILLALFWIIVISIFRQVIWFSVFWVYTPLLFVVLIILLGYKIALILFLLSLLANLITHFITKKIYILYSSKIALNYIVYVIVSIIFIWLLFKYNFMYFTNINNSVILAFFIMPLLSKNLVKEETNIFSKNFWIFVFEFFIISFILYLIFKLDSLKYILVAYPDLLWLFAIFAILVWRFSGLQVLEYIRFYPLIKKWFYEEE